MPSPSKSLATLRPDLAGSLMEFDLAMDRQGFIAQRVFPVFEAELVAGQFGRIPIAQLLQTRDTRRARGGGYSRSDYTFEDESYSTKEYGAEEPVDDNEAKMYANYFELEQVSTIRAFDAVLRNAEARAAGRLFDPTVWTGAALTTAVAQPWSSAVNSKPIDDVEAAVNAVWDASGIWPNALVIHRKVFRKLRQSEQIIDRITSSGAGSSAVAGKITEQQLADVFDLAYVIVAGSAKNGAQQGQSPQIKPIWDAQYAMVCRVAETNDIREPCIGRTFHWDADGSLIGGAVESYRDERTRGDVIRVRHQVDEKVLYKEAGHLLSNIVAA